MTLEFFLSQIGGTPRFYWLNQDNDENWATGFLPDLYKTPHQTEIHQLSLNF